MSLLKVRVIALPTVSPFELSAAAEVFGIDRRDTGGPVFDFGVVTPTPGRLATKVGFDVLVEHGLEDLDGADAVVMAPYAAGTEVPESVLEALRAAHARGAWIVSLCSGAFALALAGLLDGRRATTHWLYTAALAARHPDVEVDPDVLYVEHDRIITSAGTAASIDACLHLVRSELGASPTANIARRMVVPPHRDGGQAQYIDHAVPECSSDSFAALLGWASENPATDLSVEALARRVLLTPRTFARRFRAETGTTPAAWVGRMRLARAQEILEQGEEGLDDVARLAGFSDAALLRQHFSRTLGLSPRAYRARFRGV
ncbi:GlxA family transcriptional regulator [Serinibacter arcticus]|uniref:Transcriptional regulator containing an amidase domain and an AraC-type DNA-binding HTH domain n=1 Tax=Serinibacter arcticus TaxID=1655435 RepID=A0A4Z1DWU3_9MICO|nr:helix-turn-helix domain-containing protein [Serinibacter arcticus]TGO04036.1 Transcriptional regulator containing an amidase domain and an AraC-type DNA-binding HTH domain [Serinibacter arcticus]